MHDLTGTHVALCSGGRESTVAAHVSIRWGPCERLVYLDTGTGAESNRRFVYRLGDALGVPTYSIRTPESYEDYVGEQGFAGPGKHGQMYRMLKERQIEDLATMCNGRGNASDLHLWTGVRLRESRNRMGRVAQIDEADRWTWVSPIFDWTDREVKRYHERMHLPTNHLWRTLGRSGDCFCGAFGSPEELIDAEAAGCDRLVSKLRNLEAAVDRDDARDRWAWGGMTDAETRAALAEKDDAQMMLCSTCSPALPDGGEDGAE